MGIALHVSRAREEFEGTGDVPKDVEVTLQSTWPSVYADQVLLQYVFQHLIVNGVKFNRASPKRLDIGWRAAAIPDTIEYFVRDNGIGIPEQYHERIFHVFERLQPKDEFEGTGIGLAVVKKAIGKLGAPSELSRCQGRGQHILGNIADNGGVMSVLLTLADITLTN